MIAELAQAEKIGEALGLKPEQTRRVIGPILRQTLENYLKHGPAAAFSGPVIRGDVETVKKNLAALARVKGAAEVYRALVQAAVENLPGKNKTEIKGVVWGSQRGSKRGTSA